VEGEVAGAGALIQGNACVLAQAVALEFVHVDGVGAEVSGEDPAARRVDHDLVGVGLPVAFVLGGVRGRADLTVLLDRMDRDGAVAVVGDEQVPAVGMEGDVAGGLAGGLVVQQRRYAGVVEAQGGDAPVRVTLANGVQGAPVAGDR
jgi:hypothetical protein